ncbi:MAG TPA: GTPase Era [Candidatus Woesebacteria bacterium]|nr:GTPase Era [Candidatus Woesebacteria bacterium]
MKSGVVLLIGRPNVGKSTFVNTIVGTKVSITSPKPQTTRFPIQGIYQDKRGELIFVDTPGIFDKVHDTLAKKINRETLKTLGTGFDVAIYMVDHTRRRDMEESKVLGLVRQINKPVLLVINKIDYQDTSYIAQYRFLADEFPHVFEISALKDKHIKPLLDKLFELLPERKAEDMPDHGILIHPTLNINSRIFIGELIREKIFLMTGDEIPYTSTVVVDEITARSKDLTFIKARVLTTDVRYRKMLIGAGARKIKEIGAYARKEIELATKQKVYLELTVEVDKHWQELYS